MATLSKWLAQVTIQTGANGFGWKDASAVLTVTKITVGDYDTILEVCADLETQLQVTDANFSVAVSSEGIVSISNSANAWTVSWGDTSTTVRDLLGFDGTEAVTGSGPYVLTATDRHLRGWYPPVGEQYPADEYRIEIRGQETEAGGYYQLASSAEHRSREVTFSLLSEAQMAVGGSDSDGAGGTVDWTDRTLLDFWRYMRDRPVRLYADRTDGTVAAPGTEGTEYVTARRKPDPWRPEQVDPGDWSFFAVTIPLVITGY